MSRLRPDIKKRDAHPSANERAMTTHATTKKPSHAVSNHSTPTLEEATMTKTTTTHVHAATTHHAAAAANASPPATASGPEVAGSTMTAALAG